MKKISLIVFILVNTLRAFSQAPEFNKPILIGKEINSESEEISPLISPDGKSLYFVRAFDSKNVGGQVGGMDIWLSTRNQNGQWQTATHEERWNNKENNAVIGIHKDGKTFYLLNSYKNKDGIAFSKPFNGRWTTPQLIPIKGIGKNNLVGFYMNPSFNILLMSKNDKDSYGQEDLYVSIKDSLERWSEPLNLGPTVNTSGFEISPFLSPDGKKLYFSSSGHEGYGDADIFVTERLYNSWNVWSKPKNLGAGINSEKFDAYFSMYHDSLCFFSSNRNSVFSDIYQATVNVAQKGMLKDSIDRIIQDAQKLLSDLKVQSSDLQTKLLTVNVPATAAVQDRQLNTFLKSVELTKVKRIEIVSYVNAMTEQIKKNQADVISYFIQRGIVKESLISNFSINASRDKNYMEIKVYVQK